jgi:hypothetical protein
VSLRTLRVLRRIGAVRCSRGYTARYRLYPSDDIILVYHYVSNRGVHYIRVLWKPQSVTTEEAVRAARRALGLHEDVKLVVVGEEVYEEVESEQ